MRLTVPGVWPRSRIASSSPHEMHVSPPRPMPRMRASMLSRAPGPIGVGGTTTWVWVSKVTTLTTSPSSRRSTAVCAALMALRMRLPFMDPERSITSARLTFAALFATSPSAPFTSSMTKVSPLEVRASLACPTRPSTVSVLPSVKRESSATWPGASGRSSWTTSVEAPSCPRRGRPPAGVSE